MMFLFFRKNKRRKKGLFPSLPVGWDIRNLGLEIGTININGFYSNMYVFSKFGRQAEKNFISFVRDNGYNDRGLKMKNEKLNRRFSAYVINSVDYRKWLIKYFSYFLNN